MTKLTAVEPYIAAWDIYWPQGRRGVPCCGPDVPVIKKGTLVRYEPSSGNFYVVSDEERKRWVSYNQAMMEEHGPDLIRER